MLLHILLIEFITCFTSQDDELANHILSAQVDTWVWFAIAFFLRTFHCFGERNIARNGIENEIERSTKHGFELLNLITRIDEVVDGIDDRQTRTHIRFKEELHIALASGFLQLGIVFIVRRCSHLVGSHHGNTVFKEIMIQRSHLCARCAIHKH